MYKFFYFTVFSLFVLAFLSCRKEEKTDHQNLIVSGNTPPPYNGISSILIDNYVNKLYVDLIGLNPDGITKSNTTSYLKENKLSLDSRNKVIDDILAMNEYDSRFYQVNADLMLNGMGYNEVQKTHDEYANLRDLLYASGDTFTAQVVEKEVDKLRLVLEAPQDYKTGTIGMGLYLYRMANNLIYDEINMGSENFVKACFENMFKRSPTTEELRNGVDMVDGQPVQLLLKAGRNKLDFLDIMTGNLEFFQGRILDAYRTYLLRNPDSQELSYLTDVFVQSDDYGMVQKEILTKDEYAGFE